MKELENELSCEKASRRDLEMYVAVLAKQKDVFQNDIDGVRKELRECKYDVLTSKLLYYSWVI